MVVWKDLRDWLKEVEKIGELVKIKEEVDWDLISYVDKTRGADVEEDDE